MWKRHPEVLLYRFTVQIYRAGGTWPEEGNAAWAERGQRHGPSACGHSAPGSRPAPWGERSTCVSAHGGLCPHRHGRARPRGTASPSLAPAPRAGPHRRLLPRLHPRPSCAETRGPAQTPGLPPHRLPRPARWRPGGISHALRWIRVPRAQRHGHARPPPGEDGACPRPLRAPLTCLLSVRRSPWP